MIPGTFFAILAGYLLGTIPSAYLITRWRTGLDIRTVGDGNSGARNVWHVVGPSWGLLVGAMDAGKGAAAVCLAGPLGAAHLGAIFAGPAAILGHDYPCFRRLRGGKGLATAIGVLLVWLPVSTLIGLLLLGGSYLFLHNFDRSVVVGAASMIFLPAALGEPWSMTAYALLLFCMLWARKLHDLGHERRVWSQSGWSDVESADWYGDSPAHREAEERREREAHR